MAAARGAAPLARQATLIEATFTELGSLGLSFEADTPKDQPKIKEIKPDTQAVQHTQLGVGMVLAEVAGTPCQGVPYADCIKLVVAHPQRPIVLKFEQCEAEEEADQDVAELRRLELKSRLSVSGLGMVGEARAAMLREQLSPKRAPTPTCEEGVPPSTPVRVVAGRWADDAAHSQASPPRRRVRVHARLSPAQTKRRGPGAW